jgi:Tol biopolymer transport system component
VLYELVTGQRPFPGRSWSEIRERIAASNYVPASTASAGAVGAALDAVIDRALRPDPAARFATVRELVDAASAAIAPPPARARTGLAIGGVLVAGAAITFFAWPSSRAQAPRDAAPPPPPPGTADADSARALAWKGDCADMPVLVDPDTIVFSGTSADARDLYAMQLSTGAVRTVAGGPLTEWLPALGPRAGTVLFVRTDPHEAATNASASGLFQLDLASGAETRVTDLITPSAASGGGLVYYIRRDGGQVDRLRGSDDEVALPLPGTYASQRLAIAPDGTRAALLVNNNTGAPHVCLGDLATQQITCPFPHTRAARPAFSPSGDALYVATSRGIERLVLATGETSVVVPDADARGGIAISPDGARLVWSDCHDSAPLMDTSGGTPKVLVDENTESPTVHPNGRIAYVRLGDDGGVLVLREPDGSLHQLSSPALGRVTDPSFDTKGDAIAFMVTGDHAGIHVVHVDNASPPLALDGDANDENPVWTSDGRVLFYRWDPAGRPFPFLVDPAGGDAKPAGTRSRFLMGDATIAGQALAVAGDGTSEYFWDPVKGDERRFGKKVDAAVASTATYLAASADGRWLLIQTGVNAQILSRLRMDPPGDKPEPVYDAGGNIAVDAGTIRNDGSVLFSARRFAGGLHVISAASGSRF